MRPHVDLQQLIELLPSVRAYQRLADKHGIGDIFQDNGGKLLQLLLLTGLENLPAREGNDAKDETGQEYELKSVNVLLTQQFSTHHHLNPTIIEKYRRVKWIFAVCEGIELRELYLVEAKDLESWFRKYEQKWHEEGQSDINNPKISLSLVRKIGQPIAIDALAGPAA